MIICSGRFPRSGTAGQPQSNLMNPIKIILHNDSCAVRVTTTKHRPIFKIALAVATAPVSLPVTGVLAGSGLLHLGGHASFKKDIIKYIKTYVNQ